MNLIMYIECNKKLIKMLKRLKIKLFLSDAVQGGHELSP